MGIYFLMIRIGFVWVDARRCSRFKFQPTLNCLTSNKRSLKVQNSNDEYAGYFTMC